MGPSGTGSTSSNLPGGGGGGGGRGNDFFTVLEKAVAPGAFVNKGDIVAEFDRQYMELRLDDYRASVAQTEASLKKLKADLDVTRKNHEQSIANAKADLDKARLDMKTLPVLSDMDVERVKLALEEAEATYKRVLSERKLMTISLNAQIRNAEIELEQARVELGRAEANVNRMVLKAPIEGLVVMQTIPRSGELAQARVGDQLYPGMMFMSIVDPRSMVVNANVNQVDVERLRLGARARVRFDAYPDLELPAHVYSVGGVPKTGGQRATFVKEIPVKLKLDQIDPRVLPDLSVSADVIIESELQQASIVPAGAVFRDRDEQPFVFVQGPSGWVRRPVELGVQSFTRAAIRSGVRPKEVVALERPPSAPPASK
jgi:multidrug resistance efflux pump